MTSSVVSDTETSRDGVPITDLTRVVRSKNSGPYELTFDLVFKDASGYDLAVSSGIFTPELFAQLYGVHVDDVLGVVFFEKALAIKATIVRPVISGDLEDTDVYGAQQHAPLLGIVIPVRTAVSVWHETRESE